MTAERSTLSYADGPMARSPDGPMALSSGELVGSVATLSSPTHAYWRANTTEVSVTSFGIESSSDRPLDLSQRQRIALQVFNELLEYVSRADSTALTGTDPLALMLSASSAVLAAALPDCHHQPPGISIGPKWSSSSPPRLVLRCSHAPADGGPHCWDLGGTPTAC